MLYTLPNAAVPLNVSFTDDKIRELEQLIRCSRVGPATWESQHNDGRFGVSHQWLTQRKDRWLTEFDWCSQEQYINSFDNYKIKVADQTGQVDLHFVGLVSANPDAIPLVLLLSSFRQSFPQSTIMSIGPKSEIILKLSRQTKAGSSRSSSQPQPPAGAG